jgi:hypothetical protein
MGGSWWYTDLDGGGGKKSAVKNPPCTRCTLWLVLYHKGEKGAKKKAY